MKGKIADSIIIKVGHGIMEIPRNKSQIHYPEVYNYDNTKAKDSKQFTQGPRNRMNKVNKVEENIIREESNQIL